MGELEGAEKIAQKITDMLIRNLDDRSLLDGVESDIVDEIEEDFRQKIEKILNKETSGYLATSGQHVQGWVV
jgi:hypothetical protein